MFHAMHIQNILINIYSNIYEIPNRYPPLIPLCKMYELRTSLLQISDSLPKAMTHVMSIANHFTVIKTKLLVIQMFKVLRNMVKIVIILKYVNCFTIL